MGKDGLITRKDIIEDQALSVGTDYAKNMQPAIEANKQLVASLKEMAPLVNAFRKTESQHEFIALKQQENIITLKAINANKLLEASEISLERIKQAKLKTDKEALNVQAKIESAKRTNTKLTVDERLQNEINNRALKQEARERLGLVGAYEKLNRARTEAKNKLRELISAEGSSTAEIKKAQKEYDILDLKVRKADRAVGDFTKNVGNYGGKFGSFTSGVSNLIGAFGIVGGVSLLATVVKDVFNTTKELQSLDLALKAVTGTQEEFANQQLFLQSISQKYGLELKNLTKQFISFYVAAKDKISGNEIQEIFENISKSGSALGLSNETLERSFQAVNQMLSKGTVASEELRGQLAEAMPGAVQAMTKAVQKLHPELKNLTEKGLFEMIKQGKILASEVLPETSRQLLLLTGADKAEGIETLTKLTNRFSNSWTNMIRSINDTNTSGFGVFVKKITSGLTNIIDFTALLFKDENQLTAYFQNIGKQKGFEEYQAIMKNIANTSKENIELTKREILTRERESIRVNKAIVKAEKEKRESILGGDRALGHLQTKLEEDALVQIGKSAEKIKQIKEGAAGVTTKNKNAGPEGENAKEKAVRDKAIRDKLSAEKKLNDDLYNLEKQRLERIIIINDEITKDDTQTDEIRIASAVQSNNKQIELTELTKKHSLDADKFVVDDKDKLSSNEKVRIKEDTANKIIDIEKKTADQIEKINEFDTKSYEAGLLKKTTDIEIASDKDVAIENEEYKKNLENKLLNDKQLEDAAKKHEENLFDIKLNAAKELAKILIANTELELEAYKQQSDGSEKSNAFILALEKKLYEAKSRLSELGLEKFKNDEDKKIMTAKEKAEITLEIATEVTGELSNLASAFSESKIQKIDDEINKNNEYYDRQIELAGNDERQKDILQKERDKKNEALEKKKRAAQHKQAVFDKAINIAMISMATALSVIKAWTEGDPYTKVARSIMAGVVGAIQLAAAIATPIPKYKMGRKRGPAEVAIVGDGGVNEVISRPDGSGARITPNKPTLAFLQQDDVVHKSTADFNQYKRNAIIKGFYNEKELASNFHLIGNNQNSSPELLEELRRTTEAIKKQKTNVQVINKIDFDYENYRRSNINWRR